MLLIFISFVCFSVYFYVEAYRSALCAKRWCLAGMLLGPMAFPMFSIAQHVALRKATGFNNLIFRA
jgi:hypothetical protein